MEDELTDFLWVVSESGHAWVEAKPDVEPKEKGLFLTDGNPIGLRPPWRYYAPLKSFPGLFKTFAALEENKVSIVGFADKFGMLGGAGSVALPFPTQGSGTLVQGERFETWVSEVIHMREVAKVWDIVHSKDVEGLRGFIQWDKDLKGVKYASKHQIEWIASQHIHPELLVRFSNPLIDPALYWIQRQLNQKLEIHGVVASLLWGHSQTLGLHIVPRSLIGCLWLQLANAVAGEKHLRECPECHTWFDVSRHAARADKKFCSPSCKAAAWHRKPKKDKGTSKRREQSYVGESAKKGRMR